MLSLSLRGGKIPSPLLPSSSSILLLFTSRSSSNLRFSSLFLSASLLSSSSHLFRSSLLLSSSTLRFSTFFLSSSILLLSSFLRSSLILLLSSCLLSSSSFKSLSLVDFLWGSVLLVLNNASNSETFSVLTPANWIYMYI